MLWERCRTRTFPPRRSEGSRRFVHRYEWKQGVRVDAIQEADLHTDSLVDRKAITGVSQVQEMEKSEADKRMEQKMRQRCVQSGSIRNRPVCICYREKKKITDKAMLIACV